MNNMVAAHGICNQRKGNRMPTGCELIWLEVARHGFVREWERLAPNRRKRHLAAQTDP
jgi:hypothetical protein